CSFPKAEVDRLRSISNINLHSLDKTNSCKRSFNYCHATLLAPGSALLHLLIATTSALRNV
ncbi:hypothetical protein, partial [uncultured Roseobacter sp.]|uniref:hypothetical protein n=1 Tax=uncultured Roseobacter sp. TaxID=114847 RepID=UPI00262DC27D